MVNGLQFIEHRLLLIAKVTGDILKIRGELPFDISQDFVFGLVFRHGMEFFNILLTAFDLLGDFCSHVMDFFIQVVRIIKLDQNALILELLELVL